MIRYVDALWDESTQAIYLVSEFHPGQTIHEYMMRNPRLPTKSILTIFRNVLEGLQCIHANGVVHRDIKPGNIMIDPATLKVTFIDFGLACFSEVCDDTPGTAPYRGAPEYLELGDVLSFEQEKAIDAWALGVTIYEIMHTAQTGKLTKLPMVMMCNSDDKDAAVKNASVPQLGRVISILMSCNPQDRKLHRALDALDRLNVKFSTYIRPRRVHRRRDRDAVPAAGLAGLDLFSLKQK